MAKFKVVSSGSKLKTIVKGLPKDLSQEGEPFKALRGKKKGDSTETIGIFFGTAREGDYTKEKGKLVTGQFFQGHLKRSSKDPDNRLLLVTPNAGSPLNELVRECIKDASLKHKVVSVKPGGPEPDNVDEEQDGKPKPTSPELEQIKDKLSARLPDILLLKKDPQKGGQVTKLLAEVQTHIKDGDHAKAGTAMNDLILLVTPPQPSRPKTPPQQPKVQQPDQPKVQQPDQPKVQQPDQPKGKPGTDAPTKTEPDPLVAQHQEEMKKHPKYQADMNRQGAEKLLENAPQGSWVLRWGSQVQQVVISLKKKDGVRHIQTITDGKSVALGDLLNLYKEKNLYPGEKPPEDKPPEKLDDSEVRWKSRRPLLEPRLLEALSSPTGDPSRMRALIAFADLKAKAGEHKAALQSLDAIEDLLATAPVPSTPKGTRPTKAPEKTGPTARFTQALAAPKLDSSNFILLSMDMLRGVLGEEASTQLNGISAKYQEQDYEGAFKGLMELAAGSEEKLGGDVVALMKSKSTTLRDDPTANQSRRFYETRLATHLEEELKTSGAFRSVGGMRDVIAKRFQSQGKKVSLPAVNSPEDAQALIGIICRFNDNIEMELKGDSEAYQSKDRLERPKEKGVGGKEVDKLSRNPGVMKANAPNFTDLVSEQDSKNRVPERNEIDTSKKEGYSGEHPEVPFVASISGTTFTLVALLDDYMKANANDTSLGTNVSNIVKSFMAFYIKNGFHSYSEMQDVLREDNIKAVFTKYNVAVDLGVSDTVRDKTNKDAQDYAKGVSLKGAMQDELTKTAGLALLKKGKVKTYEDRPGKVYVLFANAEEMNAAVEQITTGFGPHTFRQAGQANTLEIYADLQRLLDAK